MEYSMAPPPSAARTMKAQTKTLPNSKAMTERDTTD